MNLLFVTNKNADPLIGGIEHVTCVLADAFRRIDGYKCYSAFTQRVSDGASSPFCDELLIDHSDVSGSLLRFITSHDISVVIAQGADAAVGSIMPDIHRAVRQASHCKLIFVFHNKPGFELSPLSCRLLVYRLTHGIDIPRSLGYLLSRLVGPLARPFLLRRLRAKYSQPYHLSDALVLLSQSYLAGYAACAGVAPDNKFSVIPNPLTLQSELVSSQPSFSRLGIVQTLRDLPSTLGLSKTFDISRYSQIKNPEALFVGRFDDRHKRLSHILRIWQQVEADPRLQSWTLRIVGYGPDEAYYRSLARRLRLTRLSFHGMVAPCQYYTTASLLLTASAFEGFPLVLLEAMQSAVVPLAYDTYGALHDIVADGTSGAIIPDADHRAYTATLMQLMLDTPRRSTMAAQALRSVQKFSVENIAAQWNSLFNEL